MPRPSVKKQRTEEIMQAFERCVIRYGVEGSTLERLAEESGLQRSLIRHYSGNRDDLIQALLQRFLDESQRQTDLLIDYLPQTGVADSLVDALFASDYHDNHYSLLANALFSAAANTPALAAPLKASVDQFINAITELLHQAHPNRTRKDCYVVASGVIGIYFNIESVHHLGDTSEWREASLKSARLLVNTLP
ncbi:MAG: hypothetical protein AseanaTS_00210 [Candidatus Pelagadaptatus aseana]|uniref:TetR/AcrR family transcriptional regulator n=1 Tax=Candidatus Pelagadaptatus aseana TaxID=3120508 RepID=UPI0039B32718